MCLDMGLDVFFSAKAFLAVWVQTNPLSIQWIWSLNETSNIINGDSGISNRLVDIYA
jgi:hypothetical protein